MGGSKPSAPVTVMPAPTAPTLYQSYTPLESYEDLAEQMKRIQAETGKIQGQRYSEVGTPAELGARQAGRRTMESAAYLASLPGGDKYLSQSTGRENQFAPVKDAAKTQLSLAQQEYANALTKLGERPNATMDETPSWAKRTIKA